MTKHNSKNKLYKNIAYGMLMIAFIVFSIQLFHDFGQEFNLNTSSFLWIGVLISIIFSLITISILKLVSKLQLYSIYHKKIANTIRILIYIVIILMFLFWCTLINIGLIFFIKGIIIGDQLFKFFIISMLNSLIYSTGVNVFFFSLSIQLPKKDKK